MDIKTLIALVDGSPYGQVVCQYAGWLAARADARVKLYHVIETTGATDPQDLSGALSLGARSELLEGLTALDAERAKLSQAHGRAILQDAADLLATLHPDLPVETRLRQGHLVDTLAAKESSGDLIVIGKRGTQTAAAAADLGHHFETLVRSSHKPVFVANRSFAPIDRLAIAWDDSPMMDRALDMIHHNKAFAGLAIDLVHAGPDTAAKRAAMETVAARLQQDRAPSNIIINDGDPSDILATYARENAGVALIMGAYGHSKLRRLIMGSTTTQVIQSALAPVILLR